VTLDFLLILVLAALFFGGILCLSYKSRRQPSGDERSGNPSKQSKGIAHPQIEGKKRDKNAASFSAGPEVIDSKHISVEDLENHASSDGRSG
jgi:hypothetical protein